jgi:hypothetical protein
MSKLRQQKAEVNFILITYYTWEYAQEDQEQVGGLFDGSGLFVRVELLTLPVSMRYSLSTFYSQY